MSSLNKPGTVLGGKYRLSRPIGAGAMGTVWAAEDLQNRVEVAVKLLAEPTPDMRQRFLREARLSSRLSHPNIVQLLDVGETDEGEPFIVLELLSGESLSAMLKQRRRLEPREAARIVRDIARALSVAHAAQIIHRDLKPANIFLHHAPGMTEGDFVVKVLDFGIAKSIAGDDVVATKTGIVVGSPAYLSPEQIGRRKDLDGRTDIWSLGILSYELLAGVRPFTGSMEDVVRQVLVAPIQPISERVRDVPPEMESVVMRCLERARDKRISSAADLAASLDPFVESSQVWRSSSSVATPNAAANSGGTALLPPNAPVRDPLPPWRREMQASLSEHRRAATNPAALMPHAPSEAVTSPEVAPSVSTIADAASQGSATSRRRQTKTIVYASIGLAASAVLALVALVVVGLPSKDFAANASQPTTAAAPESNTTSAAMGSKHLEDKPSAAVSATMAPTTAAPPTNPTTSQAPKVVENVAPAKPSSTVPVLPPCSQTVRTGCRNVGTTSAGAIAPSPFATATATTKKKSGVFSPNAP